MAADDAIAAIDGEGAIPCQPLHSAAAWTAATAAAEQREWLTVLSPAEVEEVLAAAEHALSTGKPIQVRCSQICIARTRAARLRRQMPLPALPWLETTLPNRLANDEPLPADAPPPFAWAGMQDLTAADFPLPTLGPKLAAMRRSCLHGRGFHMLRGARLPAAPRLPDSACCGVRSRGPHTAPAVSHIQSTQRMPSQPSVTAIQAQPFRPMRPGPAGFPVERLSLEEAIAAFFGLGTHWGHARSQNAKGHVVSLGGTHPPPPTAPTTPTHPRT